MTVPAEAVTAPLDRPAPPAAVARPTRPFYWSVRRELWENRSLVVAPLAAAGVVVFGFILSAVHLADNRREALALEPAKRVVAIALPYDIAAMVIIVTGLIVAAFYCLGALHNERRDRSILFWKSLPVSDLTTVLAKAAMPILVLPAIVFAVVVAVHLIMLALSSAILMAGGVDPGTTFASLPVLRMWLVALWAVIVLALWYAPIWAWLMVISAWARRAPFLWAVLPPLALMVIEKIAFDSGNFASLVGYRLNGFVAAFSMAHQGQQPIEPLPRVDVAGFLATPGLWAGLVAAAAFLAAAVWLRRRRDPV
jgi:ABC-2 type transport system permease protein